MPEAEINDLKPCLSCKHKNIPDYLQISIFYASISLLSILSMKKEIHPKFHSDAKVVCACGNTFTVGSTLPEIHIEICSACHPFYTGKQKLVDTARRVEKFQERASKKDAASSTRRGKKVKKHRVRVARAQKEEKKNDLKKTKAGKTPTKAVKKTEGK